MLQYGQFQTESLHSWPPADVQRKLPHSPPPDLVMRSRSDSSPCYPPDISDIQISGSHLTEQGCGISHLFHYNSRKRISHKLLQVLESNTKVEITFNVIRDLQSTILQITTTHL